MRNYLVGLVGPPLVRLWCGTLRVRWLGFPCRKGRLPGTPRGIYVFWHQRMLALAGLFARSGFKVLVSQHGDGEMIARIVERLGMEAVRGSTTRGGAKAVLEILREKGDRVMLAITPDGPQGPRYHFHEGAVYLASRSGLPIHLVAASFRRFVVLPTWDGFILPRPFTKALIRIGGTVPVPPDLDRDAIEETRARIEASLRKLTEDTDREFQDLHVQAKALVDLDAGD